MRGPVSDASRHGTPEDWRILRALALYRILLVTLLIVLYQAGYAQNFFDQVNVASFYATCVAYGLASLLLLLPILYRVPGMRWQPHLHFGVDLAATAALVYFTGGVSGGLGMLLLTPAVGCSLVLTPRMAIGQAAVAALTVLGEEVLRTYKIEGANPVFTQAGILGGAFFLINISANAVAQRARKSERLVEQVGSDLANLAQLNERIIESMQSGLLVIEGGQLRVLNAAARRLLDLRADFVPPAPLGEVAPGLAVALAGWQINPAREPEPVRVQPGSVNELIPRFTRLSGAVLCLLDSAQVVRNQAQQMKLAALGRLSASIAHEIRNPLAAISHAGQLLSESVGVGPDRRLLDMIQRHSQRIDRIVKDVLSLSKRESGQPQTIHLGGFLAQAVRQYQEAHSDQKRRVELQDGFDGVQVRFDPGQLQQVLGNLLDNAFEHGGRADLTVRLRGGRAGDGGAQLDVADDGKGIAPGLRERMFEPFFTTAHQGTGLGLYLARELCDYNHAHLSLVPQTEGACFRIQFPPPAAAP